MVHLMCGQIILGQGECLVLSTILNNCHVADKFNLNFLGPYKSLGSMDKIVTF